MKKKMVCLYFRISSPNSGACILNQKFQESRFWSTYGMSPSLCEKVIKSCKSMIGNQIITRQEFVKMHLCGSCVTKMLAHNNCRAKFSMTIMYQYLKQYWPAWRLAFIFMVYCNSYLAAKVFFALRQEV